MCKVRGVTCEAHATGKVFPKREEDDFVSSLLLPHVTSCIYVSYLESSNLYASAVKIRI
jgi:hypothetical protein